MVYAIQASIQFNRDTLFSKAQEMLSKVGNAMDVPTEAFNVSDNSINLELRYQQVADRDLFETYVLSQETDSISGQIQKHDCYHDEGKPCENNQLVKQWGSAYDNN